ncbi:hypothetical protein Rhopal_004512-T1 [Rhodotorula paludigena]|uniref:Uncharacterized protein n=1 Tax=Rhodotorula paludigena TaxID=86838 RepID=A0AAV5GQG0_9BASI|nr:hypothetical protein Rhopal_004512-T1 [Rhodotorula paludigena]
MARHAKLLVQRKYLPKADLANIGYAFIQYAQSGDYDGLLTPMTNDELAAASKQWAQVQAVSQHGQLAANKLSLAKKVFREQAAMEGKDYDDWIKEVCTEGFLNSSSGEGGRYGWLAVFFAHKFGLKTSYFSEMALSHAMVGFKTFSAARKDPHCPEPGSVEFGLTFTEAAQDAGYTPEDALAVLTGKAKAEHLWRFIWRNFSLDGLYEKSWTTFAGKISRYFNPVYLSLGQQRQRWTTDVDEAFQRILTLLHQSGAEKITPFMIATMFYAAEPEHFRTVIQIRWRLTKYHGYYAVVLRKLGIPLSQVLAPRKLETLNALGVQDDTTPSRARKLLGKKSEATFDEDKSEEGKDDAMEDEDEDGASEEGEGDDGEEEDDSMADADDDDKKIKDVDSDDELEVVESGDNKMKVVESDDESDVEMLEIAQSGDNKMKVVESDDEHGVFSPSPKVFSTNHPPHADDEPEWAAGLPVGASHSPYKYESDEDYDDAPRYRPGATCGFRAVVPPDSDDEDSPPDLDDEDLQYKRKKRSKGGVVNLTLEDGEVNVIDPYGVHMEAA